MTSATAPRSDAALTQRGDLPTREYAGFFRDLATAFNLAANLPQDIQALTVRVAALEEETGAQIGNVVGDSSIVTDGVLHGGIVTVHLLNDVDTPPALSFYGAITEGVKGWQAFSGTFAALDNGDGTYSLDLADLANSGAGAALVKITRDAKGRISGTSAATTTDLAEGTNLYYTDARADARIAVAKADPDGIASLVGGKLDPGQLPALAITETFVVNTQAAMLALVAEEGDVAVRTDLSKSFILTASPASTLANWQELLTPTGAVTSFNGRTGSVVPASGDYTAAQVGLGNVDNTSDVDKPVSAAQAAAIATKLSKTGGAATGDYAFDATTLVIDSVNHRIGIGTTTPSSQLEVNGPTGGLTLIRTGGGEPFISFGDGSTPSAGCQVRGLIAGGIRFTNNSTSTEYWRISPNFLPGTDNASDVGSAAKRGRVAYFGTGSINTSDAREKTEVVPLTADEMAAAADLARAPGTYQWLAAVQAKGADARHHVGLTVQRAIEIMRSHGLYPFAYGFICYDQWGELPEIITSWPAQDAVLDEAGNVVTPAVQAGSEVTQAYRPAGDRYSFRHDELLLFLARGFAARIDALEAAR